MAQRTVCGGVRRPPEILGVWSSCGNSRGAVQEVTEADAMRLLGQDDGSITEARSLSSETRSAHKAGAIFYKSGPANEISDGSIGMGGIPPEAMETSVKSSGQGVSAQCRWRFGKGGVVYQLTN